MAYVVLNDQELRTDVTTLANAQARRESKKAAKAATAVVNKSAEIAQRESSQSKKWIAKVNIALLIAGGVAVAAVFLGTSPWDGGGEGDRAVCTALMLSILFYAFLGFLRYGEGGVFAYIRGKDDRISTSFTQVALWTFAISTALLYFVCLDFFSADTDDAFTNTVGDQLQDFPEAYLLLLGGPFAAAVLARLVVGTKIESGRLQKIDANVTKLRDVISNDSGQAALVDAQFLIFNLVALVWFTGAIIQDSAQLPEIPDLLVGLTSVSALAYMATKSAESNQPIVSSITRHRDAGDETTGAGIRPGDFVEIRGANFVPDGAARPDLLSKIVVRFGDAQATPRTILNGQRVMSPSDTSIVAQVPDILPAGDVPVSVVTASAAESESRSMKVVEDKPVITGVEPTTVSTGMTLTIRGRYFLRPGAPAGSPASVAFGDSPPVQATTTTDSLLSVSVPQGLTGGSVPISVTAFDGIEPSSQVTLRLLP